jgi:hypothetical protein
MAVPVELQLGDRITLRKAHPCGGHAWMVVRLGADIGLTCDQCGHRVLLDRLVVERRYTGHLGRGPKEPDA